MAGPARPRPSVLFAERGVLLNNIAWLLRRLPVFAVGGNGRYWVRPIHVEDVATLALEAAGWPDDRTVDAVGPERRTFLELVELLRSAVGSRALAVRLRVPVLLAVSKVLAEALHDVLFTPEYRAMAGGLAGPDGSSTGVVRLSEWANEHRATLGGRYMNEVELHFGGQRPAVVAGKWGPIAALG